MIKFLIVSNFLFLILLGSCQDFNSNTFDGGRFGGGFDLTTRKGKAMYLINQKCVNCHSNYHGAWSLENFTNPNSNDAWVDAALVNRGTTDYLDAPLIKKLKNFPGGNMPEGGSNLTAEELAVLEDWIENDSW